MAEQTYNLPEQYRDGTPLETEGRIDFQLGNKSHKTLEEVRYEREISDALDTAIDSYTQEVVSELEIMLANAAAQGVAIVQMRAAETHTASDQAEVTK